VSILGKALQPIAKKIGEEVAERAVPQVAKAADPFANWGWKGGKPGEITGSRYIPESNALYKTVVNYENQADAAFNRGMTNEATRLDRLTEKAYKELQKYDDKAIAQLESASRAGKFPTDWPDIGRTMSSFDRLESLPIPNGKLGLPRKLTGKVMHAFGGDIPDEVDNATIIRIAKEIEAMTPSQLETMRVLANDWAGSVDDLLNAARML